MENINFNELQKKVYDLWKKGEFKRDVLFNGVSGGGDLTEEEKRYLYNRFEKFINEEIYTNETYLIDWVLSKSYEISDTPFNWDDVTNLYKFNEDDLINEIIEEFRSFDFEEETEEIKEFLDEINEDLNEESLNFEELEEKLNDYLNTLDYDELNDIRINLDLEVEEEHAEIYQWFSISGWLADKLEDKGQCVLNGAYWGRQCCGQSIKLDYVMQEIFLDMITYGVEK